MNPEKNENYYKWKEKVHKSTFPANRPNVVVERWEDTDSYDVSVGSNSIKCQFEDFPEIIESLQNEIKSRRD